MGKEYQVIFAGEGGQGLVVTGTLVGEAAVVFENRYASQTVDYGIASRGGFAMAELKLSDDDIDCPELDAPDYIVTLTAEAFRRLAQHANTGTTIIFDSDVVSDVGPGRGLLGYPMTTRLRELRSEFGDRARINILALGVLLGVEPVVSVEALQAAIRAQFGEGSVVPNMSVLRTGIELAREGTS